MIFNKSAILLPRNFFASKGGSYIHGTVVYSMLRCLHLIPLERRAISTLVQKVRNKERVNLPVQAKVLNINERSIKAQNKSHRI